MVLRSRGCTPPPYQLMNMTKTLRVLITLLLLGLQFLLFSVAVSADLWGLVILSCGALYLIAHLLVRDLGI